MEPINEQIIGKRRRRKRAIKKTEEKAPKIQISAIPTEHKHPKKRCGTVRRSEAEKVKEKSRMSASQAITLLVLECRALHSHAFPKSST